MATGGGWKEAVGTDAPIRGRMHALTDRGRRLATGWSRRPERRVTVPGAPHEAAPHARRVTVKVIVHDRARGAFPNTVSALAGYLAKEGRLFDRDRDDVDPRRIVRDWSEDRRVFHVIVSPNDGARIADMPAYAREVVAAWERRVGPLEWVASVEAKPDRAHPEGNRHLHVMVRGVQDDRDLSFGHSVIAHWLRHDAMEAATDRLGWMDERERRAVEARALERERRRDRPRERGRDRADGLGRGP